MKTDVVCIIDRSGSMLSIRDDAIGGFNQFLREQRDLGLPIRMTLVFFNDQIDIQAWRVPLHKVKELNRESYVPGGWTALLDAIGQTLSRLEAEGDVGEAIVCILTDGQENSSREYNLEQIKGLIEASPWQFVYLGANQDAFSVAGSLGVSMSSTYSWVSTSEGMTEATGVLSRVVGDWRRAETYSAG